jgi:hypothetical protein
MNANASSYGVRTKVIAELAAEVVDGAINCLSYKTLVSKAIFNTDSAS